MKIYLASNNKGKINEISNLFKNHEIVSQNMIENIIKNKIEIDENGKTFNDNAIIKAKSVYNALNGIILNNDIVIADDSGIIIPSWPNLLGVYTKRQMEQWCKKQKNDVTEKDFYNYISKIVMHPKRCIFEVSIAVIKNGKCSTYKSQLKGVLAESCRGENGFGFDPIFEVDNKTLAEMTDDEKQKINPRIEAINKMFMDIKNKKS